MALPSILFHLVEIYWTQSRDTVNAKHGKCGLANMQRVGNDAADR